MNLQEWKQAYWLAKFELKAFTIHAALTYLVFIVLALFFFLSLSLKNDSVAMDLLFLFVFILGPYYIRGKEFQYQKISGELWASPTLVMLLQLPVTKNVLTTSRMIVYFFYSIPYQLIILLALYVANPDFQTIMSPVSYVTFCIIWLSFGIYVGYIMPSSDAGDIVNGKIMTIYSIILIGGLIVFFRTFNYFSDYSVVQWTIMFAQNQTLLSTVLSILLSGLGFKFWQYQMKKKMEKLDYL
ncbi:hypothetical protein [Virgibacillus ainsalahensis]